jgi:hypothetical protein
MRRALVVCLCAVLTLPATALALRLAPGDGTLAVRNGDGLVHLKLRSGAVLGRVDIGRLEIHHRYIVFGQVTVARLVPASAPACPFGL